MHLDCRQLYRLFVVMVAVTATNTLGLVKSRVKRTFYVLVEGESEVD